MSLDALAPDQRAVVQLVLQQDRSYDDLAALLGITPEAVRERAQHGLDRLAPTEGVADADRAVIADYLLGQQSVSARESTRQLLQSAEPARAWALAVAEELAGVASSPLPEVPALGGGDAPATDPDPDPVIDIPVLEDPLGVPGRARPRPRREPAPAPDYGFDEPADTGPGSAEPAERTSRLGGALLIAGLGIFVAALIVWLVTRGDDSGEKTSRSTNTSSETATPAATASGTPNYQPIGRLNLKSATGGSAKGRLIVYAAQTGEVAFNLKASDVPATGEGEAYGVWLIGGEKTHFLGFAPPVGDDGKLRVSGPRESDAADIGQWLSEAKRLVVSRETSEGATEPGPLVLQSDSIAQASAGGSASATP